MNYTCGKCNFGPCTTQVASYEARPVFCPMAAHREAYWEKVESALSAGVTNELLAACVEARNYLDSRGFRHKGTVGRTRVLPMLDAVIGKAREG